MVFSNDLYFSFARPYHEQRKYSGRENSLKFNGYIRFKVS